MAVSCDINLPKSHVPKFPNRCVVCDCGSPRSKVRIVTTSSSWRTWLWWWWIGKPFVVKAPACSWCGWKLHWLRLLSWLAIIAIIFPLVWYIWPHFKDSVPRALRKWALMGLAVICLIPQMIFEVFFARPFDVVAYADSVDYQFTSQDYAIDFAMLNAHADWVKVNGTVIK